jgi:hypothetical protein
MKKNLIFVFLLVCIVALVGCSGAGEVKSYTIKVSGNAGVEFVGSYGAMAPGGETSMRSVEGVTPAQYVVKASRGVIITCSFIKLGEVGTLNVQIFVDGQVVAGNGTTAAFGSVTLTTTAR